MSSISTERKQLLSPAMADIWQMVKDFDTLEDSDDYWLAIVTRSGEIYNRHEQDDLVRRLVLAVVEAKEAEYRARKERDK